MTSQDFPAQKFHCFPQLPAEIRTNIWIQALTFSNHPARRLVRITAHCSKFPSPTHITHFASHVPPPALLSASRESRSIALKQYTCSAALNYIPVDLKRDILLLGTQPTLSRTVLKTLPDKLPRGLRHLALWSATVANREAHMVEIAEEFRGRADSDEGWRRVTIVYERMRDGERDRATFSDAQWSEQRIDAAQKESEGGMVQFAVCMLMEGEVGRLRKVKEAGEEKFVWGKADLPWE